MINTVQERKNPIHSDHLGQSVSIKGFAVKSPTTTTTTVGQIRQPIEIESDLRRKEATSSGARKCVWTWPKHPQVTSHVCRDAWFELIWSNPSQFGQNVRLHLAPGLTQCDSEMRWLSEAYKDINCFCSIVSSMPECKGMTSLPPNMLGLQVKHVFALRFLCAAVLILDRTILCLLTWLLTLRSSHMPNVIWIKCAGLEQYADCSYNHQQSNLIHPW